VIAGLLDFNTKFLQSSHLPNQQDFSGQSETIGSAPPIHIFEILLVFPKINKRMHYHHVQLIGSVSS